jgi:hypothetical protein
MCARSSSASSTTEATDSALAIRVRIAWASSARARSRRLHATRVWLQPDYTQVLSAVRHYVHTRFVALLRFDPRPEWADLVGGASEWIGVLSNSPRGSSFEFEPAPGVVASSNTFPHALYARSYADVTPAMRALCSYPDGTARHWRKRSSLSGPSPPGGSRAGAFEPELFNLTP